MERLAEHTVRSSAALGNYERDDNTEISLYAIVTPTKFCRAASDYLLRSIENKDHTNTALDELDLRDPVVDVLKRGQLNVRKIGEMICHPVFRCLLIDMELCVDRIADMRLRI